MKNPYAAEGAEDMISPCLIYYEDGIRKNIEKAIQIAGSVERLWPHVKSHKSIEMVKLQLEYGICKFKTATIAEAEMAAMAGAKQVILAYPLIGPNMARFVHLSKAYPDTIFYGVEDDLGQLEKLSEVCKELDFEMPVLIDVNMGMNRTGAAIKDLDQMYRAAAKFSGIRMFGFHCYDGNHNDREFSVRNQKVLETDRQVEKVISRLKADGFSCEIVVAGGTPSFPCHARNTNWYLSPGTAFINDAGYYMNLPDIPCVPAAAVMTRVISHPAPGVFTTDLGYKGIAADPAVQRGYIVGLEDAVPIIHSEEHWAFKLENPDRVPEIGECLYVIPTHICPTSALYPQIQVAEGGKITKTWEVTARNRKLNF